MTQFANEERELIQKTSRVLRRKAADRNFVADQLDLLLREDNRLSVQGRAKISQVAKEKAERQRQAKVTQMPAGKGKKAA